MRVIVIIMWCIAGGYNLFFAAEISKFAYAVLLLALIVEIIFEIITDKNRAELEAIIKKIAVLEFVRFMLDKEKQPEFAKKNIVDLVREYLEKEIEKKVAK